MKASLYQNAKEYVEKGSPTVIISRYKNALQDGNAEESECEKKRKCEKILLDLSGDVNKEELSSHYQLPEDILSAVQNRQYSCISMEQDLFFIEPLSSRPKLFIFGGGHIAVPLVKIASIAGFSPVVCDDRKAFANPDRFLQAEEVICESFEDIMEKVKITPSDYAVIITRGHKYDSFCLQHILQGPFPLYVGMIGSKRRVETVKTLLRDQGIADQLLSKVCAPIGLPIGAQTPEEIAVSIMAEVIKEKYAVSSTPSMEEEVLSFLTNHSSVPPSCMVTILDVKGSAPRPAGAKMIVSPEGRTIGSIGGGCAEAEVIRSAVDIIGTGSYEILKLDLSGTASDDGMVCGGVITAALEDITAF